MKRLNILALFCLFSFNCALADEDPLIKVTVSKSEIAQSLEQMKKDGKITEAQYKEASADLNKMNDAHMQALLETAKQMVRHDPNRADNLWKANKLDLEKTQLLIDESKVPQND